MFEVKREDLDAQYDEYDSILNAVAESCDNLSKKIWDIPHERIFEFQKTIDDAIATLMISKIKLEDRKV